MIMRELPFNERNAGSFKVIPQAILIISLAVAALLEGRPDIPTVLVRSPAVDLCITDDAREMDEAGASTARAVPH